MGDESAEAPIDHWADRSEQIDQAVTRLKAAIPAMEHGAIDSRLEELLNDSNADAGDVISILYQEFNSPKR